ncbi:BRCA1-associated protein [Exophiala viscosa]|uniref:BRCA1-associated protein n=1 Tax=Exophiala viscosa TaxID=2486360 RepID=A0AAN6E7T6_9EURO|nr:BRCA1-associated protein [Exophiala viscosa]
MPDYFFHVAVELFPDTQSTAQSNDYHKPPNLGQFFKALRPFTHSSIRRRSRDHTTHQIKVDPSNRNQSLFADRPGPVNPDVSHSDPKDHRLDNILLQATDMVLQTEGKEPPPVKDNIIEKGIGSAFSGHHLKGRYEPLEGQNTVEGWGIVHLYRDSEETSGLYKDSAYRSSDLWSDGLRNAPSGKPHPPPKDEECTSLCILAVPSYMTPSDFLSWVGEDTRSEVSHFRMVRTSRANRYMVLMKFKHGKKAREWQHEWNGKVFNSMEPETCHVVFLKSVELIQTSTVEESNGLSSPTTSYPRMSNDPFIPAATTTKPLAPRTPSLVELPTCPVCLERMDETTGLLTIPCQHVFHCTCLEKWSGGGCPVCRYTHDDFSSRLGSSKFKSKTPGEYEVYDGPLECEVCHVETSLWQCLICGKVGCGRYEGKHAYSHFEESGHTFSMDLESKRVWDYAGDAYVHRIIQDAAKPGEKLVELPGRRREPTALEGEEDIEVAKMDNIALEYTHLLTSQLESQRVYFEEVVERAVDKASEANKKAERAMEECHGALQRLHNLESEHDVVAKGKVPELEKENTRFQTRSAKFEEMARTFNQKYQEEKSLTASLMERVKFLEETQLKQLHDTIRRLEEDNATKDLLMEGLRDEHRDAMMQISAQRKLQEMVANGELEQEDLEGAVIEAGPAKKVPIRHGRRVGTGATRSAAPLPATSGSSASAERHDDVQAAYSEIFGSSSRGDGWDEQKARSIMDECKQKLLGEGLLVPAARAESEDSDAELDGEKIKAAGPSKKRKAKRKAKK